MREMIWSPWFRIRLPKKASLQRLPAWGQESLTNRSQEKAVQGRGGHQQLLPAGAALLGAAINQVAFRKSQHCSKFLTCLRTWQMAWTEKPKCKQNITPLQPSQTRNWVWSRQNILLETSNWFRPVLIIEREKKKLKFYKKKPLQIGMLYFFITEMSKQTHFFCCSSTFRWKMLWQKIFNQLSLSFLLTLCLPCQSYCLYSSGNY